MVKFQKNKITNQLLKSFPIILLFVSVLNEFDFNYLKLKYFSFNFPFILVFYWSLKKNESLGYGFIFIAGLFNDAVVGLPIGVSSLSYLFICGFSSYLRNITLRPSRMNDWFFFGFTILVSLFITSKTPSKWPFLNLPHNFFENLSINILFFLTIQFKKMT